MMKNILGKDGEDIKGDIELDCGVLCRTVRPLLHTETKFVAAYRPSSTQVEAFSIETCSKQTPDQQSNRLFRVSKHTMNR